MLRSIVAIVLLAGAPAMVSADEIVVRRGAITEHLATLTDPTQTYSLYLPSTWSAEGNHPLLFVFDPRQRGTFAAEIFRAGAEELGWVIISSNDTRSDGPAEPNVKALNALWPEAHLRYSIDPDRIYAAGFSGGGILTLLLATSTGEVAGVVDCGGRLPAEMSLKGADFAHYGAAGRFDFNYMEMHEIDRHMEREGQHHRLDIFEGRHQWLSADDAARAMRWLEVVAMKEDRRSSDPRIIAAAHGADLERGTELETQGRALEAYRHYEMMLRTYDGLLPLDAASAAWKRLGGSAELKRARRDQHAADKFETMSLGMMAKAITSLRRSDTPVPIGHFRGDVRIEVLNRTAKGGGARGEAAQRVLESVFTHTSFYLPNEFLARGDLAKAAMVLEISSELRPELAWVHYNLGCVYARIGREELAVASIRRAVDRGFNNLQLLKTDPDLDRIRTSRRFEALMSSIEK